ncbi:MAG: serine/threonine protein kinase [Actinobacteria bacterium]|nr:serine/threonine protein kinase [Actinomycetota bacterium]
MNRVTHPAGPGSGLPGEIAGYRVERYLGQGSMAAVYLAREERASRRVALKVLAPELARDAVFSEQVIRESHAVAAVRHPHVLPVYAAGRVNGTVYVAMRYAAGGSARSLLRRLGPLPLGYAWHVIAQIAAALDAAHAFGLIHRDVRPANILLDAGDTPGERAAYLSDFGLSKRLSAEHIIATGWHGGTLEYAAPEQLDGHAIDGRADLYALACTAFELLCGMPPFGHDPGLTVMYAHLYAPPPRAAESRADLPAAADRVLATALAKNPAERYPTCGEFAEELRSALSLSPGGGKRAAAGPDPLEELLGAEAAGRPAGRPQPPAPRRDVFKLVLIAAAILVLAVPVLVGVILSSRSHGRAAAPSATSAGRSPSPSPSAPGQAAAVSALLASSAATRSALHGAVRELSACTNVPGAVGQLRAVVNQRTAEARRASTLLTTALPDGTTVKSDLAAALASSLASDRDFLAWARQQQADGCAAGGQSDAYNAAVSASQRAEAAKLTFTRVWNPVAAKYGIKPVSPGSF